MITMIWRISCIGNQKIVTLPISSHSSLILTLKHPLTNHLQSIKSKVFIEGVKNKNNHICQQKRGSPAIVKGMERAIIRPVRKAVKK